MTLAAKGVLSRHRSSREAGRLAALEILESLQEPPKVCLSYLTVNHDQEQFLAGLAGVLGEDVPVVGCSGQGVMGRGGLHEEGYAASVLALAGDGLEVAAARAEDLHVDTRAKGEALTRSLLAGLTQPPRVTVLLYDLLSGVNVDVLLGGMSAGLSGPILGGAAAHFFDAAITTTYQYFGTSVFSKGAVAFSLAGDFCAEIACTRGCAPAGIEMTITKIEGNMLLELDGRPALDVWTEITASRSPLDQLANASVAFGVPPAPGEKEQLIRCAFYFDPAARGMLLGAAIPEGTRVTLYHRTVADVVDGSAQMGRELRERLAGKRVRAVLGFECGGRTRPFLGTAGAKQENLELQQCVAADAEWCGLISWGELFPVAGRPGFHNYAFPLLALAD